MIEFRRMRISRGSTSSDSVTWLELEVAEVGGSFSLSAESEEMIWFKLGGCDEFCA